MHAYMHFLVRTYIQRKRSGQHTPTQTNDHVCVGICIPLHPKLHACKMDKCAYVHFLHIYICMCNTCISIYIYVDIYVRYIYICIKIHTYVYIYIYLYTHIDIDRAVDKDMGSCQNRGPLLGTLNTRCRSILGTQKGTLILTTAHIDIATDIDMCVRL